MTDEERNELVVSALPVVRDRAYRFAKTNKIRDCSEIFGIAYLLAVKASRKFDPKRNVPFLAFLKTFLHNRLIDEIIRKRPFHRLATCDDAPDKRRETEPDFRVLDWIPTERERKIIQYRLEGFTLREIADRVGCSPQGAQNVIERNLTRWYESVKK